MVTINCVNCDYPEDVEIEQIDKGQFIICKNCNEQFNLFGIYNFLYNSVSLAKKIVDILTAAVYGNGYRIIGNPQDQLLIEQFRTLCDFDPLLRDIIFDTVLFGNAFLEKGRNGGKFFKRVDPSSIEIVLSAQHTPLQQSIPEQISKLIQHIPINRDLNRTEFIHFPGTITIPDPLGKSVLGFWFPTWYSIVFVTENRRISGMRESGVIKTSGVPHHLVYPETNYPKDTMEQEIESFRFIIKLRRERISRIIQEEIFPTVLLRSYTEDDYPSFEFI